jgi:hypothetical protein
MVFLQYMKSVDKRLDTRRHRSLFLLAWVCYADQRIECFERR